MGIVLRTATAADIPMLKRWDEAPHVVESNPNDTWDWEWDFANPSEWREALVAEVDGRPVGFVQIIDPHLEETHYWGECEPNLRAIDIWIGEADCLNQGLGTQIMKLAIERCFADKRVTAILIDPLASNTAARRFYERLGFAFVEYRKFGDDECAVYSLARSE